MSDTAYDDAVVVAHDSPAHHKHQLRAAGYRVLLLTGRHTVYVTTTSRNPNDRAGSPAGTSGRRTLTVTQAATLLGISRSCAYDLARTGELPTVRLGRRLVVPEDAITDLLERHRHEPATA